MRFAGRTKLRMQIAIVLVSLCVALLAWMIGRAVSRPLSAMTRAMGKLADGDFDVVVARARPQATRSATWRAPSRASSSRRSKRRSARRRSGKPPRAPRRPRASRKCIVSPKLRGNRRRNCRNGFVRSAQVEASASSLRSTAESTQERPSLVAAASEEASANVQSVAAASRGDERVGHGDRPPGPAVGEDRRRGGRAGGQTDAPHRRAVAGRRAASATWSS